MVPLEVLFRCPSDPGVLFHKHDYKAKECPFEKRVPFVVTVPQGHRFGTYFSLSVSSYDFDELDGNYCELQERSALSSTDSRYTLRASEGVYRVFTLRVPGGSSMVFGHDCNLFLLLSGKGTGQTY